MKRESPKKGRRLPLPKKGGGPIGTKKGAKGYRRSAWKRADEEAVGYAVPCVRPTYETIDHTADLGIRVTGESLERLFEQAGLALFDLLTKINLVRPNSRFKLSLRAENTEALFVQWLRELLYVFYTQRKLFCAFEILRLEETSMIVTGWGERYHSRRHVLLSEIKAVTYHELYVKRTESGWEAQVIFDI